ncbi:MAG: hypothetical protein AAB433_05835 [Nitrospirota bacterium]
MILATLLQAGTAAVFITFNKKSRSAIPSYDGGGSALLTDLLND